jgi:deoxyadenosine/deoxycytidine kinase
MYIGVVGNYATGKTTLISELSNDLGWTSLVESPESEATIVERFYDNPQRWAFTNQVDFFNSYVQRTLEAINQQSEGVLQERTLLEINGVFNEALRERGYLSKSEYDILQSLYRSIDQIINLTPDLVIYLHCDVNLIIDRIDDRGRNREKDIGEQYIRTLNRLYDDWARNLDRCPVIKIDSSECNFHEQSDRDQIVQQIRTFG